MNISPTDLRISTHTATCNINSFISLELIAKYLEINDKIKYIEHGKTTKGENMKIQSKKAKEKKRVFFNQITVIVEPRKDRLNNVKLFNNGAVSMTGLKNFDEGQISINLILDRIKHIKGVYFSDLTEVKIEKMSNDNKLDIECKYCDTIVSHHNIKETKCQHYICNLCSKLEQNECKICNASLIENGLLAPNTCKIKDYKIVLINSDYYLGFEIKRDVLHELLSNKYYIFSSYEPCIYPGVNSKYYFNNHYKNNEFEGKCYCDVYCDGKGNGYGNGECKKITIAIFQSGSIIITGARNMDQIKCAHKFINTIIDENYELVKKEEASFININEKKKIIKLKKVNIVNYPNPEQLSKILSI
jgi:TATA-box binding protein (TBP) (component of TFIID and TFIIIB)